MQSDMAEFATQRGELAAIEARFDMIKRFPSVPIVGISGSSWVLSFDDVLSSRFAGRLRELVDAFGDESVEVLAVDEDAEKWSRQLGILPGFVAKGENLVTGYLDGLWDPPRASAGWELFLNGSVFAVAGSSGKWALWTQRDWEIGLLVTTGDFQLAASEEAPFVLPGEDFEMWRGPAGWTLELTPAMLEEFRVNIRALTD